MSAAVVEVVAVCALAGAACASCAPPSVEGGACYDDDTCSGGLACDDTSHCVRSCAGDVGTHKENDCLQIPTAGCTVDSNGESPTFEDCAFAARAYRPGVFDAAFACLRAIPADICTSPDRNAIFDAGLACLDDVHACANHAAKSACENALDTCRAGHDDTFAFDDCVHDVSLGNARFVDAWATCFGEDTDGCTNVEAHCVDSAGDVAGTVVEITP